MRETTALIKEFDNQEELLVDGMESAIDAFRVPERNWNRLVDAFNETNKKKFPFSALQCKLIVEYSKKGLYPKSIFEALGVSAQKYTHFLTKYNEMEDKLSELSTKQSLTEEETEQFHFLLRHPLRILIADIDRAKAIHDLGDWERLNEMAQKDRDVMMMIMKARHKEVFGEKQTDSTGHSIVINLGSDVISDL